ncbi:MAG: L-lactate permease [Anaerolineae bacterium]|nr:L-lactate permease [Anaerolineae bacterium]
MNYFLAFFPILLILALMLGFRWGGHLAGLAGWLAGVLIATLFFGMTFQVWWVSQIKGLLLSLYVILVLWSALFLFHIVNQAGGIQAIALWLEASIRDRGLLLVLMAWAFGGFLEGMAGFGIPVAIVAPMLVGVGVSSARAVAAVAVGHSWAVSFGGMGMVFQTLTGIVQMESRLLAGPAAAILGIACLLCGLAASMILGQRRIWPKVVLIAALMATVQYSMATSGLIPLAALIAGLAGLLAGLWFNRNLSAPATESSAFTPLKGALSSYGGLVFATVLITLPGPLHTALFKIAWIPLFPQVETSQGFLTPAGPGTIFRFFLHPGAPISAAAFFSYRLYRLFNLLPKGSWRQVTRRTVASAGHASLGVIATVGLSTLMDHCGMTLLLAQGLSAVMQMAYPLVSPLVGMLGAFATGSNNNSNVLFASLQKNAAILLGLDPRWLLAAQTAGGSLGSMVAPAKIIVGCSTVGLKGRDGEVLRITLLYGLVIGLLIGAATLALSQFS